MSTESLVEVVDSHTGGEPTRVIVSGGPDLGTGPLAERRQIFEEEFDWFRASVIDEPRGSDILVGALLTEPTDPSCDCGVLFFNNVGTLNMCGHGAIGVAVTLAWLEKSDVGHHKLETPVGVVPYRLHDRNTVTIENVESYRLRKDVEVSLADGTNVRGDVAWGGNWFFLTEAKGSDLHKENIDLLTDHTWEIRKALSQQGITGADEAEIDHIELFGPPSNAEADSKNFVLCPGKAYDRSPCGTGTSAKLACLYEDGHLQPGQVWKQESIIGSIFEGRIRTHNQRIFPSITGSAYVCSQATLIRNPDDPFAMGIPKAGSTS